MTGQKLTAMMIFGSLSFIFGILFSISLFGVIPSIFVGVFVAVLTAAFIFLAKTNRYAFARGFIGLGVVFLVVPMAAIAALGPSVADGTGRMRLDDNWMTETAIVVVAFGGLVFGTIIGLVLVLIGGLMHRTPKSPVSRPAA